MPGSLRPAVAATIDLPPADTEGGGVCGLVWGAAWHIGWRSTMEDAHLAAVVTAPAAPTRTTSLPGAAGARGTEDLALFGVFDGHSGDATALGCVAADRGLALQLAYALEDLAPATDSSSPAAGFVIDPGGRSGGTPTASAMSTGGGSTPATGTMPASARPVPPSRRLAVALYQALCQLDVRLASTGMGEFACAPWPQAAAAS